MIKEYIVVREVKENGVVRNVMICKTATQAFDFCDFAKEYFGLNYVVGLLMFENGKRI